MTLWFGVGLILYVHLAVFLVGYVYSREIRKLRFQAASRDANYESRIRRLTSDVNALEEWARCPGSPKASAVPPDPGFDASKSRRKVMELASQGCEPGEIARQVQMPRPEVDLLIKLGRVQRSRAKSAAS